METHTPKLSQIVMTCVGLALFAAAMMLNHYHPHNQGIADISHSIYNRLGIGQATSSSNATLGYIAPLPKVTVHESTKIADPTTQPTQDHNLPTVTLAGGQPDPTVKDTDSQSQNSDKSQQSDQQPNNASDKPKPDTNNQD